MTKVVWIPACAGMTKVVWIPACAGMTAIHLAMIILSCLFVTPLEIGSALDDSSSIVLTYL
jgi:hypothetical protein